MPSLLAVHDRIMFGRADGRCECYGECGRRHQDPITGRCTNKHGLPPIDSGTSVVSLSIVYVDGDEHNNADANLVAMCQLCARKHRDKVAAERKAAAERRAIEAQHEALFELPDP